MPEISAVRAYYGSLYQIPEAPQSPTGEESDNSIERLVRAKAWRKVVQTAFRISPDQLNAPDAAGLTCLDRVLKSQHWDHIQVLSDLEAEARWQPSDEDVIEGIREIRSKKASEYPVGTLPPAVNLASERQLVVAMRAIHQSCTMYKLQPLNQSLAVAPLLRHAARKGLKNLAWEILFHQKEFGQSKDALGRTALDIARLMKQESLIEALEIAAE